MYYLEHLCFGYLGGDNGVYVFLLWSCSLWWVLFDTSCGVTTVSLFYDIVCTIRVNFDCSLVVNYELWVITTVSFVCTFRIPVLQQVVVNCHGEFIILYVPLG